MMAQFDAKGNKLTYDIREDEEQQIKHDQIIELLVAAGYFRARIKTLPSFDKVVGGMVWCITSCNFDVDVDLLFQENSTIGQQISLTEKIVSVLVKMKAPHRIDPHQIQGLDFIHIFPIMQWLVKRAMETRAELGDFNLLYGVHSFEARYQSSADSHFITPSLMEAPRRLYRRSDAAAPLTDPRLRIHSTLLEYGHRAVAEAGTTEDEAVDDDAEREAAVLMSGLALEKSSRGGAGAVVAASAVGSILSARSDELQRYAADYAQKVFNLYVTKRCHRLRQKALVDATLPASDPASLAAANLRSLRAAAEHAELRVKTLEKEQLTLKSEYLALREQSAAKTARSDELARRLAAAHKLTRDPANARLVETLRSLIARRDKAETEEREVRAAAKAELASLNSERTALLASVSGGAVSESESELAPLEDDVSEKRERLATARRKVARKTREIGAMQRTVDNIPTRAELNQYQKRFAELYAQVSVQHKETKQFFTLYNTLEDKRLYMTKEIALLDSIFDGWRQVRANPKATSAGDQFIAQLETMAEAVRRNRATLARPPRHQVEKRKASEAARRDELLRRHGELVALQRRYARLLADFRAECKRNEQLTL